MTGMFYLKIIPSAPYPLRKAWYSGYLIGPGSAMGKKWQKTEWKDIKNQRAKRVEQWTGEGEGPFSPDVWSARFARRYFFSLFSATGELGPRLECLTKPLKTYVMEANSHGKNSPYKSQNGTRRKEGDNQVYLGVSHHFYFEPSCNYNQHDF